MSQYHHNLGGQIAMAALACALALPLMPTTAFSVADEQNGEDSTVSSDLPVEAEQEELTDETTPLENEEALDNAVDEEAASTQDAATSDDQSEVSEDATANQPADATQDEKTTTTQAEEADAQQTEEDEEEATLAIMATASDLLNPDIWLKQPRSGECTLTAATMMLRRAAILNGNPWRNITVDSVRSTAWTYGGLRWYFSAHGMSVAEEDLSSSNEQILIDLLEQHPEGIIAYSEKHSVLLTDYTDGILYCADPSYGDRRPLTRAAGGCRANNITQYWYVSSDVADVEPEYYSMSSMVGYTTHVQNEGWQVWSEDGQMAGTSGQALRLEGIKISLGSSLQKLGSVTYTTHVQNIGWQDWVSDGELSGTTGQALRLEAIKIKLTGALSERYDIYYRVHAQNIGWMGWAKNGEAAGTAAHAYRLEGIQIVLRSKNSGTPGESVAGITSSNDVPFQQHYVRYRTHVQNVGWQDWSFDGAMAGTSGQALRLEGINISLSDPLYNGSIQYCTHVQNIGWQQWVANGAMSGTSGRALRLEGIRIKLTSTMAAKYDIYYRVHAQNFGWMGWAKNGECAGTAGYAYRLEGIQIVLVEKGGAAPSSTYAGIQQTTVESFLEK